MVRVYDALPSLNATAKNIWLEFGAWQWGQVSGPGLVATPRAYFDRTAPSDRNLKLAPLF